eukprot:g498.t1
MDNMSYNELRRELKRRNLSAAGTKVQLRKRLAEENEKSKKMQKTNGTKSTVTTSFLSDPSVLFLAACVVAPLFLEMIDGTLTLSVLKAYLYCGVPVGACLVGVLMIFTQNAPREAYTPCAMWYLVNGVGFKSAMDTFSGSLQSWSLMTKQYNALEARYAMPLSNFESLPVHLTSLLEISVMTPMCLWVFYLIVREPSSARRYVAESSLATLQMAGTWYFYMPLILTSSGDRAARFFHEDSGIVDFYFRGVFGTVICPLIWIIVPLLRLIYASSELSELLKGKK